MPCKDPAKRKAYDKEYKKTWQPKDREAFLVGRREQKRKRMNTEEGKLQRRKEALKHNYGMSLEEYYTLFENQQGRCAVCGTTNPGHNHKHFCVDHDHETGNVRGLLCHYCNRGLGFLGDSMERVENLLNYLVKYKESNVRYAHNAAQSS